MNPNRRRRPRTAAVVLIGAALTTGALVAATPAQAHPASHREQARAEWITSFRVAAAEQDRHLDAAIRDLSRAGERYMEQQTQLAELAALPLTDTTARQRAEATQLVASLNTFFGTHVG